MWSAIAGLILSAFKWLFGGKQQDEGEQLGKTEAERDAAYKALNDAGRADAARNSVRDDPSDIARDPNNLDH